MQILNLGTQSQSLVHIILVMLTLGVMVIATIQTILLAWLEYTLHKKCTNFWTQTMPALQTMENFLFQLLGVGWVLLTIVILVQLSFFHNWYNGHFVLHGMIAFLAWLVFGGLLVGRWFWGWRGQFAIRLSLTGIVLLLVTFILSFYGTR